MRLSSRKVSINLMRVLVRRSEIGAGFSGSLALVEVFSESVRIGYDVLVLR
jgi:hypothetical protein